MKTLKLKTLFACVIFILVFGCTSKKSTIELSYPKEEINVALKNLTFYWEGDLNKDFRFTLSRDAAFNEIVVDTMMQTNTYLFSNTLEPSHKYFWRVSQHGETKESFFTVKDVWAQLPKYYREVNCRKYYWDGINGILSEEYFKDTLFLEKNGNSIRILEQHDGIDKTVQYHSPYTPNILFYLLTEGHNNTTLEFRILTDSIFVSTEEGGLGGGIKWAFGFKQ